MSAFSQLSESSRRTFWAVLALRHASGIGPLRAKRLWQAFGGAEAAVKACLDEPAAWFDPGYVPPAVARKFASGQWRDGARKEWEAARASDLSPICLGDSQYPALLLELPDPPLLLYCRGDTALLNGPCLGVVGSRNCTREGIAVAAFFSRALSAAGLTVISGMAKGIDRVAHLAALEGPGKSIGVLGTGVDQVYPVCNADLQSEMAAHGLLISEFAPGTPANARHFPVRNRIISGLAHGILVVEAADRSGSLITARLALEQGREVFAVPGHTMAAVSGGCRELIRQGAKAVFNADDILGELAALLSREAQLVLEKRFAREASTARKNIARDPSREPRDELLAEATTVLPEGGLPWIAPEVRSSPTGMRPGRNSGPASNQGLQQPGPGSSRTTVSCRNKAQPAASAMLLDSPARHWSDPAPELYPEPGSGPPAAPDKPGPRPETPVTPVTADEARVLAALTRIPAHIDPIAMASGLEISRLSGLLTHMELRGLVKRAPGMLYSLPERPEH